MRRIKPWPAAALATGLVLAGAAVGQPPPPKDVIRVAPGPGRPARPGGLGTDEAFERLVAFDKNKDGKVARDELPERMHDLVARGDANKDGALDKDEIQKLVAGPGGTARVGGPGFGTTVQGDVRIGPGPGGPGPGPGGERFEGVVEDLKLPGEKKGQALAAVKAHEEEVRKLMAQAREDLFRKLKGILTEDELKDFKAALDRPRGEVFFTVPDGPRPKR
jgi:hypothetical protein